MSRLIVLLLLLLLAGTYSYAQEANFNGARNESLAEATVALQTGWSLFTNPSGMNYHEKVLMAGYQSKYVQLGIHDGAFGFTFPVNNTALGIGVAYFGDELLSKTKAIASASHKIGKTSLGIKTTYEQWNINELGSKGIFYVDIGGQMVITDQFTIGMVITNLNQAKFDTLNYASPVTEVKVGINYHPHEKLLLLAQLEKDVSNPALLRLGIEYLVSPNIALRTGILPNPTSGFAGIGFNWKHLFLDLSGSYQQNLGWSGSISFDVPLKKGDEK
ncbi:MAG: hypothetical protein KDC79_06810 [Cyclobacteriaceae bacterium]|nr:hypothetical protein [Cyclobacteriaceae bacterium]